MSITLVTPWTEGGGGQASESDPAVALTGIAIDFQHAIITATLQYGTATPTSDGTHTSYFTPGSLAPTVTVTITCTTGQWSASNGTSGQVSGAALTALNAILATAKTNALDPTELFCIAQNIFGAGGVLLPW